MRGKVAGALLVVLALSGCVKLTPEEQALLNVREPEGTSSSERAVNSQSRLRALIAPSTGYRAEVVDASGSVIGTMDRPANLSARRVSLVNPTELGIESEEYPELLVRYTPMPPGMGTSFEVTWKLEPPRAVAGERRSKFLVATYPLWGLPRDLIDAPCTGLRRLGFADKGTGVTDNDPATPITLDTGAAVGAIGSCILVYALLAPAWYAIPVAVVALPVGGAAGLVVGMNVSFIIGPTGRLLAKNVQTPLLRSGIDSVDYFPNWKFVAHRPTVSGDAEHTWKATSCKTVRSYSEAGAK